MMKIVNEEIREINKEILDGLVEPFSDNDITKFVIEGSKRIRSKITLLYLKSLRLDIDKNIYKILAAGELMHDASLLHDDVIDDALVRRNKTTLSQKYSSKISILAGDYLLSYAIEKLLEVNNLEIIKKFKNCAKFMSKAEIKQYFLRSNTPNLEEYLEICTNKTAQLFAVILESCAIISNHDSAVAKALGLNFGIYFQLKNDLEKASANQDKINEIHTAIDIIGIEKTQILLDNYKEEICKILSKLPDNIYKKELRDLLEIL